MSEKKRGKRKAKDEDGTRTSKRLVSTYTRQVSRATVAKTWRSLSFAARSSIQDTLNQAALDVLNGLALKDRAAVQPLLSRIEAQ